MTTTTKRTKRSDIHRPGAIVPRDYVAVLHYHGAASDVPSFGVNCELDRRVVDRATGEIKNGEHDADGRCCIIGLLHISRVKFAGSTCKCSICGAAFVYGSVWVHAPSGEHIHVGHECAEKYDMIANHGVWNARVEALKTRRAAMIETIRRDAALEAFFAQEPYMRDVLAHEHPICQDMRAKVRKGLSEKQIDLACSIYARALCPERPTVAKVPAPEGRIDVEGVVISRKCYDGAWGPVAKITVRVATPDGEWLAWGSSFNSANVGERVRFRATLTRGDEPHFAAFKRPIDLASKEV